MNFMVIFIIVIVAWFIYCSIVIPIGKSTSERELKKLYDDSGLTKYLNSHEYQEVINVSRNVANAAKFKKEEYVWKYFYKEKDDETILKEIESIEKKMNKINLNAYNAYEKAKVMKEEYYNRCMSHIIFKFPCSKAAVPNWDLIRPLNKTYNYVFYYVSPKGYSTLEVRIPFDYSIKSFIKNKIEYKNSAKGQRSLMTDKLRKSILERDNYTCKKCGNSTYNEPNLLLEVDHIIPISKGGKTIESNLQTLCWKCNRSKSNKM